MFIFISGPMHDHCLCSGVMLGGKSFFYCPGVHHMSPDFHRRQYKFVSWKQWFGVAVVYSLGNLLMMASTVFPVASYGTVWKLIFDRISHACSILWGANSVSWCKSVVFGAVSKSLKPMAPTLSGTNRFESVPRKATMKKTHNLWKPRPPNSISDGLGWQWRTRWGICWWWPAPCSSSGPNSNARYLFFFSLLPSSLESSDPKVYEL